MSYYDPHRVFNNRRTADQKKGQSIQTRLIDQVEPRVDPEVLRKAKRLCEVYNLIPQPRLPLQIKLTDVTFDAEHNHYPQSFAHQYLNSINAPNGYYLITFSCQNGVPFSQSLPSSASGNSIIITHYVVYHDNTANYDRGV